MSADLIPFAYHATPVRVVTIDGEPWFVLADLCRVLTLSSPHKVYDRIADDAKGRTSIPTPGGDQQMAVVSEAGMYEVVIRSDKAEAVEFRRWITGTVLPEIRKTGSYGAPKLAELSRRDILTMALEAEDRADREAAARLEAESQVRELIPPASAWNALADTNGDYAVGDAAKILSRDPKIATGERRLFAFMKAIGWVFRRDGHWCAYQTQIQVGRLTEIPGKRYWHEPTEAWRIGDPKVRVTAKGLGELHKRLGGTGQLALMAVTA
jgi:anti-repressor protein